MRNATVLSALGFVAVAAAAAIDTCIINSFNGDMTYHSVGLGACGTDSSGQDMSQNIVALNVDQMGSASNNNPYCGKTITISGNGKTVTGTILDKCMGCAHGDIDVSEKVFINIFGSLDVGRGKVSWSFS